jgi:hypothetical protein
MLSVYLLSMLSVVPILSTVLPVLVSILQYHHHHHHHYG